MICVKFFLKLVELVEANLIVGVSFIYLTVLSSIFN